MNILFSTTYYHPYVSGLSLYIRRIAGELAAHSYDINVLCMKHNDSLRDKEIIERVSVDRARTVIPLSKGFLSFDFVYQAWVLIKKADVVVINLPQFEGVWVAVFGKIFQKKVIAIYHSEIILPRGFINSIVQSIVEISNMMTLVLADVVVTYTKDFASHSRLLRWVTQKVEVTFPPIPVPVVSSALVKKLESRMGDADIRIGVAARLASEKGLEYLFEAIPVIQNAFANKKIQIVIAGPDAPVGERSYRKKIRRLEKKYKESLVFLGEIDPEKMGAFYALLDVLILPSVNSTETFGMVQVEAMMTGVPVVASNLPGVRIPIAKTGMGIVVPPKDVQAIASATISILRDRRKYVRSQSQVAGLFSLERTRQFYERLFID